MSNELQAIIWLGIGIIVYLGIGILGIIFSEGARENEDGELD